MSVIGFGNAAQAAPYAAMVMDMRTGAIVHQHDADRRQHPASLTKMMTLYLTFEAVRTGQLSLDQRVRVSRHAASQPASKLYLKAGQRVTIRDLIRAAAIKSANDAAMVLAEAIGGSEANFARLMTEKARAIGMSQTTFRNPHGLTHPAHLSTARDMATLARQLYFDFPQYYNIFSRKQDMAAGKRVNNTNRLLSSYSGAEGMKTGYTRAAGYNLAATASRGSRRVLVVVLGGNSTRTRNAQVAKLLDMAFAEVPRHAREIRPSRIAETVVASAPVPLARPDMGSTGLDALAEAVVAPAVASVADQTTGFGPLYASLPVMRPGAAPVGDTRSRVGKSSRSAEPAQGAAEAEAPKWSVQLGAFYDEAGAVAQLNAVKLASLPTLKHGASEIAVEPARSGRTLYKVRFVGLEKAAARAACSEVRKAGRDCLAMAPR